MSYQELNSNIPHMSNSEKSLIFCDCIGNAAYAFMLKSSGLLSDEEYALVKEGLKEIALLITHGKLEIDDVNAIAAIDSYLHQKFKTLARKVKIGRSLAQRHLMDMRLCWRASLLEIIGVLLNIEQVIYEKAIMPQAVLDSLAEGVKTLQETYTLLNRLPVCEAIDNRLIPGGGAILAKLLAFESSDSDLPQTMLLRDDLAKRLLTSFVQILNNLCQNIPPTLIPVVIYEAKERMKNRLSQMLKIDPAFSTTRLEQIKTGCLEMHQTLKAFHAWISTLPEQQENAKSFTIIPHMRVCA